MEFRLLGPFQVVDGDGREVVLSAAKVRTLLALLLVRRGEPVSVDAIADALWGNDPPASAVNLVHGYVRDLRRVFGRDLVLTRPAGYLLERSSATVDADLFDDLAAAGQVREALALWRGAALAEWVDESWARPTATRLEEARLVALEQRLAGDVDDGRGPAVVAELTELVTELPLREGLHALLVRALYQAGRQSDALAAYQHARRVLAEEVGVDPGPELVAAQRAVLAHDPALGPRAVRRWGVPVPTTPLLGREEELAQMTGSFESSRLVTVVGPGGVGKTRLAVAASMRDGGSSGDVWFVGLVGARRASEVTASVAEALRLAPSESTDPTRVVAYLRSRPGLLVLDNCEHVAGDVAALVAVLLTECAGLRVLATSRQPLGLPGEQLLPLAGLASGPAAQLFEARARAVNPSARMLAEIVRRIVDRLDRLPLALELAAARAHYLSVAQIESGLARPLDLLGGEGRGTDPRHRTMRAVIGWSHDLLEADDQAALAGLSVFVGRFSVGAAEQVIGGRAAEQIGRLLARCLLVREDDTAGEATYRVLEVVREYATERAHPDHLARARVRHVQAHADFAADLAAGLRTAASPRWAALARVRSDDLRAAVRRAAAAGSPQLPGLVADLHWAWFLEGRLAEYLAWNEQARSIETDLRTTVRLDRTLASTAMALGQLATAEDAARRCVELAPRVGDEDLVAIGHGLLGMAAWARGDADAMFWHAQALDHARCAGEPWMLTLVLAIAGRSAHAMGDHRRGEELLDEAVRLAERLGEPMVLGLALDYRAHAAAATGSLVAATDLAARALAAYRRIGYQEGIASAITLAGTLAVLTDRVEDAARLIAEAREVCERLGHPGGLATIAEAAAVLHERCGDPDGAADALSEASHRRVETGTSIPTELAQPVAEVRARLGARRTGPPIPAQGPRRSAADGNGGQPTSAAANGPRSGRKG